MRTAEAINAEFTPPMPPELVESIARIIDAQTGLAELVKAAKNALEQCQYMLELAQEESIAYPGVDSELKSRIQELTKALARHKEQTNDH